MHRVSMKPSTRFADHNAGPEVTRTPPFNRITGNSKVPAPTSNMAIAAPVSASFLAPQARDSVPSDGPPVQADHSGSGE